MSAEKVLIQGESGTGKTFSMKNMNPDTTAIVSPEKTRLPFRNQFKMLYGETDSDKIIKFIDELNNWYIRRSRRRFWKSENDTDKAEAYEALYIALKTVAQVASPFVPFITEEMWLNLRTSDDKESVHLCDYPVPNEKWINEWNGS